MDQGVFRTSAGLGQQPAWNKDRRDPGSFTLLELLVTMSIITVLLAMLAPTLSSAKEKTRRATCMNNLRQIGGAFYMYLNDREGTFPKCVYYTGWLPSGWVNTDNDVQWALRSYLGGSNSMDSDLWVCPSAAKYGWPVNPPGLKKFGAPPAWNYKHDISYRYINIPWTFDPVKIIKVNMPSKAALMWDLPDDTGSSYTFAHVENVNCLFADGHVAPTRVVPGSAVSETLVWYEGWGPDRGWEGVP